MLFRRKAIAGVGRLDLAMGAAATLQKGIDDIMRAMTAKPANRFEHLLFAKHLGWRRYILAAEPGQRFFGLERDLGLIGKDMAAGGTGNRFAHALEPIVHGFTLYERIFPAGRADDFNRPRGCFVFRFIHRRSVWKKYALVVKYGDGRNEPGFH